VLKRDLLDQLLLNTCAKLKTLGLDEDNDIYPRNLRALLI